MSIFLFQTESMYVNVIFLNLEMNSRHSGCLSVFMVSELFFFLVKGRRQTQQLTKKYPRLFSATDQVGSKWGLAITRNNKKERNRKKKKL